MMMGPPLFEFPPSDQLIQALKLFNRTGELPDDEQLRERVLDMWRWLGDDVVRH